MEHKATMSETTHGLKGRITALYALLVCANVGAWAWALIAFHQHPMLLGTALLAGLPVA